MDPAKQDALDNLHFMEDVVEPAMVLLYSLDISIASATMALIELVTGVVEMLASLADCAQNRRAVSETVRNERNTAKKREPAAAEARTGAPVRVPRERHLHKKGNPRA